MAPEDRITSVPAAMRLPSIISTPTARPPSTSSRRIGARVRTVRFARPRFGAR